MASVTPFEKGDVRGFLRRPNAAAERGLVLTHGAGGNCRAPLLVAAAEAFSAAGFVVLRGALPFGQRRLSGPPSPAGAAADRAGLRAAVDAMHGVVSGPLFLAGQSYGGRQATLLAAEQPEVVSALLLFSYPLHPPGKPDRLRTDHFPRPPVPPLSVQGPTDPSGPIAEFPAPLPRFPAPTALPPTEVAGHVRGLARFILAP